MLVNIPGRSRGHQGRFMIPTATCTRCDDLSLRLGEVRAQRDAFENALTCVWRALELFHQYKVGRLKDFEPCQIAEDEARKLYLACYGVPAS